MQRYDSMKNIAFPQWQKGVSKSNHCDKQNIGLLKKTRGSSTRNWMSDGFSSKLSKKTTQQRQQTTVGTFDSLQINRNPFLHAAPCCTQRFQYGYLLSNLQSEKTCTTRTKNSLYRSYESKCSKWIWTSFTRSVQSFRHLSTVSAVIFDEITWQVYKRVDNAARGRNEQLISQRKSRRL